MASQVRIGAFIYRINPANDKELQRCTYGSSGWSRVTEFNGTISWTCCWLAKEKTLRYILTDMSM